jgi:hypothetical protein
MSVAYRLSMGRPDVNGPLGKSRRKWKGNIEMRLKETGLEDC